MAYYAREKYKENKILKRLRITLLILYFILIIMTTFSFIKGETKDGVQASLTAFQMVIQIGGFQNSNSVALAVICSVLLLFPTVEFFFCIFDKKSNVKFGLSIFGSLACIGLITFGIGSHIGGGALISLLLYVLTFFLSVYGILKSIYVSNSDSDDNSDSE